MSDYSSLPKLVAKFENVLSEEDGFLKINESLLTEIWQRFDSDRKLFDDMSEKNASLCYPELHRCILLSDDLLEKAPSSPLEKVAIAAYCKALQRLCENDCPYFGLKIDKDRYQSIMDQIKLEQHPLPKDLVLRRLIGIHNNDVGWINEEIAKAQKEDILSRQFAVACNNTQGQIDFNELIKRLGIENNEAIPAFICEVIEEAWKTQGLGHLYLHEIPGLPEFTEAECLMIAKALAKYNIDETEQFLKRRPLADDASRKELLTVVATHYPELVSSIIRAFGLDSYKLDRAILDQLQNAYETGYEGIFWMWDSRDLAVNFSPEFRFQLFLNDLLALDTRKKVIADLMKESNDPKFVLAAFTKGCILYHDIPTELKQDREFVLELLNSKPRIFAEINPEFQTEEVVLKIIPTKEQILSEYQKLGHAISADFYERILKANPTIAEYQLSDVEFDRLAIEKKLVGSLPQIFDSAIERAKMADPTERSKEIVRVANQLVECNSQLFDRLDEVYKLVTDLGNQHETVWYKERMAAINFAQIVLYSDDFVKLIEDAKIPKNDKEKFIKLRKYFDIMKKLPMELQMITSNMAQDLSKLNIGASLVEWALKYELGKMVSKGLGSSG